MNDQIIIVLDVSSRREALHLVQSLRGQVGMFKIGSQLFMAEGPTLVREIVEQGSKVFLDLKFHDIPNTVMHAAIEAAELGISMMTIHASGGRAMMTAVAKKLKDQFGQKRPLVVAVTVLTSLDEQALQEVGMKHPLEDQVCRLACLANDCGVDGVVCSPQEIAPVRNVAGSGFKIVTPGIRMEGQALNDQQRTATPREALTLGADYLVIGRSVTADPDPYAALARLLESTQPSRS
jgi:orotidine-5'-phosphate decarboxylase